MMHAARLVSCTAAGFLFLGAGQACAAQARIPVIATVVETAEEESGSPPAPRPASGGNIIIAGGAVGEEGSVSPDGGQEGAAGSRERSGRSSSRDEDTPREGPAFPEEPSEYEDFEEILFDEEPSRLISAEPIEADIDGDGISEIVRVNTGIQASGEALLEIMVRGDQDTFVDEASERLLDQDGIPFIYFASVFSVRDFDDDGSPDIVLVMGGTKRWLQNNGEGVFQEVYWKETETAIPPPVETRIEEISNE